MAKLTPEEIDLFIDEINSLRILLPNQARELDDILFEIITENLPKCGDGNCPCQIITAELFHFDRELLFAKAKSQAEVNVYESP